MNGATSRSTHQVAGIAAVVIFSVALFWALSPRLKAKWMEYVIVGGASAVFGVAAWWALGHFPVEAPIAAPELTGTPQQEGGEYYLVVQNDGALAVVWADIKIIGRDRFEGGSDERVYQGYWEGSREATATLRHGQRARLVLGGVRDGSPPPGVIGEPSSPISRYLRFSFYDPSAQNGRGDIEQTWSRSQKHQEHPKPHIVLGVTLRSDPPHVCSTKWSLLSHS
jgi:hypothetical protein